MYRTVYLVALLLLATSAGAFRPRPTKAVLFDGWGEVTIQHNLHPPTRRHDNDELTLHPTTSAVLNFRGGHVGDVVVSLIRTLVQNPLLFLCT